MGQDWGSDRARFNHLDARTPNARGRSYHRTQVASELLLGLGALG